MDGLFPASPAAAGPERGGATADGKKSSGGKKKKKAAAAEGTDPAAPAAPEETEDARACFEAESDFLRIVDNLNRLQVLALAWYGKCGVGVSVLPQIGYDACL